MGGYGSTPLEAVVGTQMVEAMGGKGRREEHDDESGYGMDLNHLYFIKGHLGDFHPHCFRHYSPSYGVSLTGFCSSLTYLMYNLVDF